MKPIYSGLLFSALLLSVTGCALKEAVTPPPPANYTLPPQAQALLDQPIPQCSALATPTQEAIDQQKKQLAAAQSQLERLRQAELARWDRRRTYLEDELEFYRKEVKRTGGSLDLTKAPGEPALLKLSTTGNFSDQVKKQHEREYNESQYRRFHRALQRGEARHSHLIGLYQEREEALKQSLTGCTELQIALQKAKEDEALHRNTRGVAHFGQHDIQVVEVLPQTGPLESPVEAALEEVLDASPETAEATQPPEPAEEAAEEETLEEFAETMEELLRDALQESGPMLARP